MRTSTNTRPRPCCANSGCRAPARHSGERQGGGEGLANNLGGPVGVVKAQIHAGGRGKAGGVKVVKFVADVKREAERLLGSTLVTHQTGPHGKEVHRLYIEEGSAIEREVSSPAPWSIAPPRASPSSPRPKAAWRSKKSRARSRKKSSRSRSTRRPASWPITPIRSRGLSDLAAESPSRPRACYRSFTRPSCPRT